MPPGLVTVAILAGCWTITRVVKYVFGGKKQSYDVSSPGSELTASELEALVRRSVEEATAPLHDKIERLERRLSDSSDEGARRLQEKDYGLIDEWPEAERADADVTRTRRQQRA